MVHSTFHTAARLSTRTHCLFQHTQVVDHYERPRNVGSFDKADPNVGTGLVGAPACGDVMKLQIKVDDEGNIVDSCFKTFGCGSAIASSSVATEWYGVGACALWAHNAEAHQPHQTTGSRGAPLMMYSPLKIQTLPST